MERLKNAALVFCLFIVLLVVFSSYFRANAVATLFGALAGTPILVHVFNRLAPRRREAGSERTMTGLVAQAEPISRPTEQIVVSDGGVNGRA